MIWILGPTPVFARPRARRRGREPILPLVEMVGLGLSAGLSFQLAVTEACRAVGGEVAVSLDGAVRTGGWTATGADRLLAAGRHAAESGAPLLPAVDGIVEELRGEERQRQLERARKLPVKLLFPLALLILPGFLLLTVGPVVAGSLERLQI